MNGDAFPCFLFRILSFGICVGILGHGRAYRVSFVNVLILSCFMSVVRKRGVCLILIMLE